MSEDGIEEENLFDQRDDDDIDDEEPLEEDKDKSNDEMDDDTEHVDIISPEGTHITDKNAVPKKDRKTTRYMTKFEKARVLGTRALQIRFVDGLS